MAGYLPRRLPHEMGVPPEAVTGLVQAWETDGLPLHSLMLVRHGAVVAEGWWAPYRPQFTHTLNSLSKSFTSTAVGFAVQEKRLTVEDRVLDFFPGKVRHPSANMRKMRVKHLLSMSTGQIPDTSDTFAFEDMAAAFLASEVRCEPGSRFAYNTGATYMLSAIVQRLTGQTVYDYLQPRLFEPLGIENIWWERCPKGISMGGVGLNLHTEDIAKFGLFLLRRGAWEGRQLLDPAWIDAATAYHIPTDTSTESPWLDTPCEAPAAAAQVTDWTAGYGYQFWRCTPAGVYRGDGAFGQFCIVMPAQDAVLAVTAGSGELQGILTRVWQCLLPALAKAPLPADPAAQQRMEERLAALAIAPAGGRAPVPPAWLPEGRTYQMAHNRLGITRVRFDFNARPDADRLYVTAGGREYAFACGRGRWLDTDLDFAPEYVYPFRLMVHPNLSASSSWRAAGEYELQIVYNRTPYTHTVAVRFEEDRLTAEIRQNVGGGDEPLRLQGAALYI